MAPPTAEADPPAPSGNVELRPAEQAVLGSEVGPFARTLPDPVARARYAELEAAVRDALVPPHLVGLLEAMLELVLQTRRVRRQHGPEAEAALLELFHRTPRGAARKRAAREVTRALRVLEGQPLRSLTFAPTPAGHRATIATESCEVVLTIDRGGVRLERLDVGA